MRQLFLFVIIITISIIRGVSQKISYQVSFPNAAHHEAVISVAVEGLKPGPAIFRMSRSSPGRYATHEFGKNVYDVKAVDRAGTALPISKVDGDVYEVTGHTGFAQVFYTLFANYGDGTYSSIDPLSVHLNMPATFMWIKGYDNAPIEVKFEIPKGNAGVFATQLKHGKDAKTFSAPGLQYFMDSPTKIGDIIFKEWEQKNSDGKTQHFRIAYEVTAGFDKLDEFTEKVKKIVKEEGAVFTEFPTYDFGTYTFLASINPYVQGDGMEHRNSTMISNQNVFDGEDDIEVFSHEFFHCWNVERIRPKTIEPFNFEKSNMSSELWLAEGFTQYYGELVPIRAGLVPQQGAMGIIASALRSKLNTAGGKYYSPIDASRQAIFVDAGVSIDKTNYQNTFLSYYNYGSAIALALDFELRIHFKKTLDEFMQALWKRFGKTEIPYTVETVQEELGKLTSVAFAKQFFDKYIYGHEAINYADLLKAAGYSVAQDKTAPWIGNVGFRGTDNGLVLTTGTTKGTPIYEAGLDVNDIILKADGKDIRSAQHLKDLINSHKPGDNISIVYNHREKEMSATIIVGYNPQYNVVSFEKAGLTLSNDMKAFREKWLGSQIKF